jgi:hypothetical protein
MNVTKRDTPVEVEVNPNRRTHMTTTKQFELRASAVRAAKKAGFKDGEFEVVQVREAKGKSHWEFKPKAPVPVATESAGRGPITTEPAAVPEDHPKRELVIVDYVDQPKAEEPAAPPVATAPTPAMLAESKPKNKSTVANPTKTVWAIADEMKAANAAVTRRQVVDECVRRGIALYTARTQYQRWSKAKQT